MRVLPVVVSGLLTFLVVACQGTGPMRTASEEGWSRYGAAGHGSGSSVALGALAGDERGVVVEGTITDVCPVKGCWINVTDGGKELFVRFKDYGFFVPRNAAGHRVVLHGTAESKLVPVDELRHYARDAGQSDEEIAAITEPETKITFMADCVYIEGEGLDAPWTPEGQ